MFDLTPTEETALPAPSDAAPVDRIRVRARLAARIRRVAETAPSTRRPGERSRLYRLALPIPHTDPLAWARAQPDAVKLYWQGREDDLLVAGVGLADRFGEDGRTDYATLLWRLRSAISSGDAGLRYYGGLRFDPHTAPDASWRPFGSYLFCLPRFELHTRGRRSKLICNLAFPRDRDRLDDILGALDRMPLADLPVNGQLPTPVARRNDPAEAGWIDRVERALETFRGSTLEKVVLARRTTFSFDRALDPLRLLQDLREATPNCFHFAFQPEHGRAFIGASPEQLYDRNGQSFCSEAVAGTRPRGATSEATARFARELLASEKDRREHEYVRRWLIDQVGPLSTRFTVDREPSVMELSNGQHLQARFRSTLGGDVTDADLLGALHPTPAVGGHPRPEALELIRDLEPFDRGWYAGPVGWVGAEGAEFAVAIRSGLVEGRSLALFSGAGIVEGSEPTSEWDEIEQKIGGFTSLFLPEVPVPTG